jgi:valyl-tRNA synthetase
MSSEIAKVYEPQLIEDKWGKFWIEKKFSSSHIDEARKPFVIVIPPPNVTGSLHMGHALNNTLQDIIIRFRRMQGFNALWVPGTDHGGIATQNVVEKLLLAKGKSRHQIGREKFIEAMWAWRKESGDTILRQLEKLGCSLDWDRTRFTMDEVCSRAVSSAFVTLYNKGLIYRGKRLVNWCPRCNTALSDIEVEHEEELGKLWHIKYPVKGSEDFVVVATTRPETMLGDTAVAVNPEDERYKKFAGKTLVLPLMNREIPIVTDSAVDPAFGTGAVKVTPAHDPTDFDIGQRHGLAQIVVIDFKGSMTDKAGDYKGLDRYAARKKILQDLEEKGLLLETADHHHAVGHCYRCDTVIEPLVSEQWFLKVEEMSKRAMKAGEDDRVRFYPESWKKPYVAWLENLRDWCISRQIWWGHRIPVYYCKNSKLKGCKPIVSATAPEKCPDCGGCEIDQDPDVLDTWFSSALWPFSVFGDNKAELDYYYPTSVLVTGHEILYLWVARMVQMGLEFRNDVPFSEVFIHGIVRDKSGKKMSKSLGNVIDPLDVMAKYGTDALRFAVTQSAAPGRDMQLADDSFMSARNFMNKLWNASRFVFMNLQTVQWEKGYMAIWPLELCDHWILSEYRQLVSNVTAALTTYDMDAACRLIYDFFWSKYCDWYIELAKIRLNGADQDKKKAALSVLIEVLGGVLS